MPIFNQAKILFSILQPPVIIVGMHRSGTTLLAQLLHKAGIYMGGDFTAYYESNYFQKLNRELMREAGSTWDNPVATSIKPEVLARNFVSEYTSFFSEPHSIISLLLQSNWGWKDPRNTFTLTSWLKVFPGLKVIHMVRNGIDVSISLFERNLDMQAEDKWYSTALATPEACFDLWESYVNEAHKWKEPLGKNYLEVRYEDILDNPMSSLVALEGFAKVKFKQEYLQIIKTDGENKNLHPSFSNLRNYARQSLIFNNLNYGSDGL